jgi:hypothetical protein
MAGPPLGSDREPPIAKVRLVAKYVVVVVISVTAVVGTIRGDGFWSPWLLTGLALVPVLLWLTAGDR